MNTLFEVESIRSREEIVPLVHVRKAHKEVENEIVEMLSSSGALLKGHFSLESGKHSNRLLRFAGVAGNSGYVNTVADRLIGALRNDKVDFDAILTQEAAGRVLGSRIASELDKRMVVVETDERNRPTANLINETTLYRGDRVLIVSDVTTTGSGLRAMANLVRKKLARPVAAAVFVTRNTIERAAGLKVYALADLDFEEKTYGSEEVCELCREGKLAAIPSWEI